MKLNPNEPGIAVFIDADNASARQFPRVLEGIREHGRVIIKRAYGNWKSPRMESWERAVHEHAIYPVQQFAMVKGKNATDMAMTIDVMDTLYSKPIDVFCLVTSDCDFAPLANRLQAEGKVVIGVGKADTSKAFQNACSHFIKIDLDDATASAEAPGAVKSEPKKVVDLVAAAAAPKPKKVAKPKPETKEEHDALSKEGIAVALTRRLNGYELRKDTKLLQAIDESIAASMRPGDSNALLGAVGVRLKHTHGIDPSDYGHSKLKPMLKEMGVYLLTYVDKVVAITPRTKEPAEA